MNSSFFKYLTIMLFIGIVSFLVYREVKPRLQPRVVTEEPIPAEDEAIAARKREALRTTKLGSFRQAESKRSMQTADLARRTLSLRVGPIGSTPERSELFTIDGLPFRPVDVRRSFINARERVCRLLPPGTTVSPPVMPPSEGQRGTLGRQSVFTIGLALDDTTSGNLPVVTEGQVKHYFSQHRVAIQPTVYYDPTGQPYFGTECSAAFFELNRPGMTVSPEPMIETAMNRFRVLGIIGSADGTPLPPELHGRTLALAFTFLQRDKDNGEGNVETVTEYLLLHLPAEASAEPIKIEVFVTSDGRANLHRIETEGFSLNAPLPVLTANIQFNKTVLMGMYPADPIVSGVRYRSAGVLAMETLTRLSRTSGDETAISVTEILDQFSRLAVREETRPL